jgi:AcrR family transcriptional regulator
MNERSFMREIQFMTQETLTRGESTRQEIIQAAHGLFVQQGYHGTSMRQIALRAGIALGGLYNHFSSKEEVFRQVLFAYHPYHWVIPALLESAGTTVEEFVRAAVLRIWEAMKDQPGFLNLLFIEIVEFKSAHIGELYEILMPQVMQIIQRVAQSSSDQLRPIPPLILIRLFIGSFLGYYMTEAAFAPVAPPEFSEGALDQYIEVLLHGILKPQTD